MKIDKYYGDNEHIVGDKGCVECCIVYEDSMRFDSPSIGYPIKCSECDGLEHAEKVWVDDSFGSYCESILYRCDKCGNSNS